LTGITGELLKPQFLQLRGGLVDGMTGMTLVELMISLGVIALILAIASQQFNLSVNQRDRCRFTATVS
jgi:prepilin-type N-terminal cleavage/methylation domain-containing protein